MSLTGVISNNTVSQFLADETYGCINLDWLEHCSQCDSKDHVDCGWEDSPTDTLLIGSWKLVDGEYEPDKEKGDYAAIVGECETQVIWSKYTRKCKMCSPCFPHQGDLDSEGEYESYDVPPEAREEN